jgi:hypothetical protein
MDPLEEQRSLKEHPLPFEGDDKLLPTRIAYVQKQIDDLEHTVQDLQSQISDLYDTHHLLVDHAVKTDNLEDERYRLEKKVTKGDRVVEATVLKERFNDLWPLYEGTYLNKFQRKAQDILEKAKTDVLAKADLGIADKVFGKEQVTSVATRPETVRYELVVKKKC